MKKRKKYWKRYYNTEKTLPRKYRRYVIGEITKHPDMSYSEIAETYNIQFKKAVDFSNEAKGVVDEI